MKECIYQDKPTHHASYDLEKGYGTFSEDGKSSLNRRQDDSDDPEDNLGSNWMSRLPPSTLLSALTIPGTHDSCTYTSPWPFISTQTLSIPHQLSLGIRYFDLRIGIRHNIPELVHGVAYLGLTLTSILSSMTTFLSSHPGETLIIQIKQDRKPSRDSTLPFSLAISLTLSPFLPYLLTTPTTPTLSLARGKIQLFRRYPLPRQYSPYGINVSQWQDNPPTPFTITNPRAHNQSLTIQDHYSFSTPLPLPSLISAKQQNISSLLSLASSDPDPSHWYINFTSAYEINVWFQIPPKEIAVGGWHFLRWVVGINLRLRGWVEERGAGRRLGVVVMDFPERGEEVVEMLILTNFGKEGGRRWERWMGGLMVAMVLLLAVAFLWMLGSDL